MVLAIHLSNRSPSAPQEIQSTNCSISPPLDVQILPPRCGNGNHRMVSLLFPIKPQVIRQQQRRQQQEQPTPSSCSGSFRFVVKNCAPTDRPHGPPCLLQPLEVILILHLPLTGLSRSQDPSRSARKVMPST